MESGTWRVHARARGTGALAMAIALIAAATSVPRSVHADAAMSHRARHHRSLAGRAISLRDGPLTVALGATHGDQHTRALLQRALSDAIAQYPALRLQPDGARGASIVLSANVRALTVQRDPDGALVRCDVGLVVADGSGAVRAMLDARRTLRADGARESTDEALARTALQGAMDGAIRRLVESGQWMGSAAITL
jgi:hypothetical protein